MTYNYVTTQTSPLYHIVKPGRIYALCGVLAQRGKTIYDEPPAGKKECVKCAKVWREQTGNTSILNP